MEERRDSFRFTDVQRGVEDVQRTLISRLDSQLLTLDDRQPAGILDRRLCALKTDVRATGP